MSSCTGTLISWDWGPVIGYLGQRIFYSLTDIARLLPPKKTVTLHFSFGKVWALFPAHAHWQQVVEFFYMCVKSFYFNLHLSDLLLNVNLFG